VTAVVVHMVKEFAVSLEQLHNDSTRLTLHGFGARQKLTTSAQEE
jgi:hypothetical protein